MFTLLITITLLKKNPTSLFNAMNKLFEKYKTISNVIWE